MEGTLAEIRLFAGNFAPRGWVFCNGQLLPIAQWTAVFALVGTTYGGDGQVTFAVPDLRGRVPVSPGNGAGLTSIELGEQGGVNNATLALTNLPLHGHTIGAAGAQTTNRPSTARAAVGGVYGTNNASSMAPTGSAGGGNLPFSVVQPYLGMNYVFCVEGIFPSRN